MYPETWEKVEELYKEAGCPRKSDFIEQAVRFYVGYMTAENKANFLPNMFLSNMRSIVRESDNRNNRMLFKLAVEIAKEGAEIIVDNTQITLFGGFAPNSSSAETLSKALGSRTVMSGSISRGKDNPSQSLQMVERPLMTPDELKSMEKGDFIVMKTGVHPMKVHLKLFFKWGIEFDEDNPYTVPENGNRKVEYAEKQEIQNGIMQKYHPESVFDAPPISEKANRDSKPHGTEQENIFDDAPPLKDKERKRRRGGATHTQEQTMNPLKAEVNPSESS